MKKKIFTYSCIIAFVAVILTTILMSIVQYNAYYSEIKKNIKSEVNYIAKSMDSEKKSYLESIKNVDASRITWIDTDGTVLYDTNSEAETMENHSGRPEVSQALLDGSGESTRLSLTIGNQTYYYAIKLDDGTILRISVLTNSMFSSLIGSMPFVVMVLIIVFAIAVILADMMTKKIIKPINELNLDVPSSNEVYDEFAPLLRRLKQQNEKIEDTMDELRRRQIEFSAITDNMGEGFMILDSKANILSYNASALKILDVNEDNCIHKNVLSVNRSIEFIEAVETASNGQSVEKIFESGGRIYVLMANPVIVDSKIAGIVFIMVDETEKEEREKMRKEFSANVSHELKTPLTAISGYAEIMKNGIVKPEDMIRFSEKIYKEAGRLIVLVGDIIKISRLDERDVELEKEVVDLYEVGNDVLQRLSDKAMENDVSVSISGSKVVYNGVKQVIDEMIFNLCENAIKYNKKEGNVTLSINRENGEAVITVSDTGIGIPLADIDRVFERFYRVDKSHSKETGGTGLGLSIVKHAAAYHGGRVEMNSILNQGTNVKIFLPNAI